MRFETLATAKSFTRLLIATAASAGLATALTTAPAAADQTRTEPFGKSGHWTVYAVADAQGFNHCAARVSYKSGIKVGLLGYANGNWSLQFFRDDWAERPVSTFDVRLDVDGRQVLAAKGKWSGKSAFVTLGNSSANLTTLMNGTMMTVVTAAGSTQFRLDGSAAAIKIASTCRQQTMAAAPRRDAPKSAANGAFDPPASGTTPRQGAFAPQAGVAQPIKLSRTDTMSFAQTYLAQRGTAADFLAEDANVLKQFPLNWRSSNGVVGGAMVITGTSDQPKGAADSLLAEQRQLCKGSLSAANRSQARLPDGSTVELVSAQCTSASESYAIVFQLTSPKAGVLVVISEVVTAPTKPIAGATAPAADEL